MSDDHLDGYYVYDTHDHEHYGYGELLVSDMTATDLFGGLLIVLVCASLIVICIRSATVLLARKIANRWRNRKGLWYISSGPSTESS